MQIHVSPRHLPLTAAIHAAVAGHIGHLEEIGTEILAAHVVLLHSDTAEPKSRYQVKVHLALPGPDIHAQDEESDLYAALERVTDKLSRQLKKRKASIKTTRRKTSQRVAEGKRVKDSLPNSVRKELKNVRKMAAA